jgi:hypothetical protein
MTRPDKPTSPSNDEDKWVRAHVTEVFNYEEDAEGIDLSDTDYPEYDWDVDDLPQNLVGSKSSRLENAKALHELYPNSNLWRRGTTGGNKKSMYQMETYLSYHCGHNSS